MMTQEEVKKFLEEHKVEMAIGMVVAGFLVLAGSKRREPWRGGLPPVHERHNSAWRGKGSFGSAPFGSQVGHRR